MFRMKHIALSSLVLFAAASCGGAQTDDTGEPQGPTTGPNLPAELHNYANPPLPAHFSVESERFHMQVPLMDSDNTPASNPTTDEGATLGRVLFYDKNLSSNRTVACASCHKAEVSFSDDEVLSKGFADGDTGRHSMSIINARFYGQGRFFWDQRAATLEDQVLMPFQDPVEMGMTLQSLQERVQEADYYPALFQAAFGSEEITTEKISQALAQFVRSMVSYQSKYDEGRAMVSKRSDAFPNFSDSENRGKSLFVNPPPRGGFGCFVCHQGEGFIAQQAESNGLDLDPQVDLGYGAVTELGGDEGTFKVPSLRNVAIRAPFMHDGRFATLSEVIDHYSDEVQASPNLGPPFFPQDGSVNQIQMTAQEKTDLEAFLTTLTDESFASDPKFSDPFPAEQQ